MILPRRNRRMNNKGSWGYSANGCWKAEFRKKRSFKIPIIDPGWNYQFPNLLARTLDPEPGSSWQQDEDRNRKLPICKTFLLLWDHLSSCYINVDCFISGLLCATFCILHCNVLLAGNNDCNIYLLIVRQIMSAVGRIVLNLS